MTNNKVFMMIGIIYMTSESLYRHTNIKPNIDKPKIVS